MDGMGIIQRLPYLTISKRGLHLELMQTESRVEHGLYVWKMEYTSQNYPKPRITTGSVTVVK